MAIVALNLRNSANLSLLRSFLEQHSLIDGIQVQVHTVSNCDFASCDLLIVDVASLRQCRTALQQWRMKMYPVFFPVLLLLHTADVSTILPLNHQVVDETLIVPVHKWELLLRLTMLLRLRNLSLTLQESYQRECQLRLQLQAANVELNALAYLDGLTQIANRLAFNQRLHQEWSRLSREQQFLAIILCDVDYFKRYNDTYGHPEGDRCLQMVAQALQAGIKRPTDFVARYGGEEFIVLLPATDGEGAMQVVAEIQQAIASQAIPHSGSEVSQVITLSYGVASDRPSHHHDPSALIQAADRALYEAKQNGRNQARYGRVESYEF